MQRRDLFKKAYRFLGGNGSSVGLIFMIAIATSINASFLTPTKTSVTSSGSSPPT